MCTVHCALCNAYHRNHNHGDNNLWQCKHFCRREFISSHHKVREGKGREGEGRERREGKSQQKHRWYHLYRGNEHAKHIAAMFSTKEVRRKKGEGGGGRGERWRHPPRTPLLSLVLRCQYDFVAGHDSHWRDTVEDGGRHLCGWAGLEVGIRSTYEWWAGKEAENVVIHYFILCNKRFVQQHD